MKLSTYYQAKRQSISIRISHQKQKSLYKIFNLEPKYWNAKTNQVRSSHPESGRLNATIKHASDSIANIVRANNFESPKQVRFHLEEFGYKVKPIKTEFTTEFIKADIIGKRKQTSKNYNTLCRWLQEFDPTIRLHEWTKVRLHEFKRFLEQQPTLNSKNTIIRYLTDLRATLNHATYLELLSPELNPFRTGFTIESFKPKDIKLELHELKKLYALSPTRLAARWFMLMYLLDGARPNEAAKLKWTDINNGIISFVQSKTGKQMNVTITPKLQALLQLFINDGIYIVNVVNSIKNEDEHYKASRSLQILNPLLRKVCIECGIKEVTSHVARHTFAYLAQDFGYSILELQQALNHSKPEITADYVGRLKGDKMNERRKDLHDKL